MNRDLKFRIVSEAEMTAIARANAQLSKFATTVGVDFNRLSQIVRSSGGDIDKACAEIDRMATRAAADAERIEKAWAEALKGSESAAGGWAGRMKAVMNGVGGKLESVFTNFMKGGVWGLAANLFTAAWQKGIEIVRERQRRAHDETVRESEEMFARLKSDMESANAALKERLDLLDRVVRRQADAADGLRSLAKAEIELARQRAVADGMDPGVAEAAAADLSARVDFDADEEKIRGVIELNRRRADEAARAEREMTDQARKAAEERDRAEARIQDARERRAAAAVERARIRYTAMTQAAPDPHMDFREEADAARREFDEGDAKKMREELKVAELAKLAADGEKAAADARRASDEAAAAVSKAETALKTLAVRREAHSLRVENERDARLAGERARELEEEARAEEKAEAERKAAREKAAREEKAAEEERIREKEAMERKAARARLKTLHDELRERERAESSLSEKAAAAGRDAREAFALWRDPAAFRAARKAREEDERAERRLERDFARLRRNRPDWRDATNLNFRQEATRQVMLARERQKEADRLAKDAAKNTKRSADALEKLNAALGI